MSLRYACPSCGEQNTVRFLATGESAQCPHCRAEHPVPEDAVDVGETQPRFTDRGRDTMPPSPGDARSPSNYPMFRALAVLLVVGAVVHAGIVLFGIAATSLVRTGPGFLLILGVVFEVLVAIGLAQGIWAILEIVANTRAALPPAVDVLD